MWEAEGLPAWSCGAPSCVPLEGEGGLTRVISMSAVSRHPECPMWAKTLEAPERTLCLPSYTSPTLRNEPGASTQSIVHARCEADRMLNGMGTSGSKSSQRGRNKGICERCRSLEEGAQRTGLFAPGCIYPLSPPADLYTGCCTASETEGPGWHTASPLANGPMPATESHCTSTSVSMAGAAPLEVAPSEANVAVETIKDGLGDELRVLPILPVSLHVGTSEECNWR